MRVYLGGNVHNNWRYEVINKSEGNIEFYMPYKSDEHQFVSTEEGKSLVHPDSFTTRDLLFLNLSDLLFGYIRPYGEHSRHHGLMIEIGYMKAQNKPIILVCEMPEFDMATACASVNFATLKDGINYLNWIAKHNPIKGRTLIDPELHTNGPFA